jgi:hypothetical protein
MEPRALIIAIQNYSQSQGLFAQTLEGTHDSARRFYEWLLSEKHVKPECIFLCSDGEIAADHPSTRANRTGEAEKIRLVRGGSRSDIVAATLDLIDLGQDDTSELFVFFSGHGFAYRQSPWRMALDVLVASDFRSFRESGTACVKLDELRVRLCTSLGGIDHYFLIDACRNVVDESQFQAIGLGISPSNAQLGTPTVYTLYSVKYGEPAPVNPKFAQALLQGLHGEGHAKGWVQGQMYVKFDLLCDYVEDQVKPRQIDSKRDGNGKGKLFQLPPPVTSRCDVVVVDASPQQTFQLEINSGSASVLTHTFTGNSFTATLEPNDRTYTLQVSENGKTLEQFDPPPGTPLDMYSNCSVKFRHGGGPVARSPGPLESSPLGIVDVVFAPGQQFEGPSPQWSVQLRNLRSGEVIERPGSITESLAPGKYLAKVLEDGTTAVSKTFQVLPGRKAIVDLLSRKPTPFQQAFLERTMSRPDARVADFSESLGPTANWSTQLWLAYLGAAHILRDPGMYYKLGKIPLTPFDDLHDGESGFLVLSAVEGKTPQVALSRGEVVQWAAMEQVQGIPTLYQARLPIFEGTALFSIKFADLTPISYATCALPNRVTLLIISRDNDGPVSLQQFMLVPAGLQGHLPPELQWKLLPVSALKVVRFISLAQQRFAERRSVAPRNFDNNKSLPPVGQIWRTLLDAKWTDPILALVALYDIVRQGAAKTSPYSIESVLHNLERYFSGIPDVAVLRRLLLKSPFPIEGTPLFLEGALSSRDATNTMTLSQNRLDFNSVWTSWRDAVRSEELGAGAMLMATSS